MMVATERQAGRVRPLTAADSYEPDWPATVLGECTHPLLFIATAPPPPN